VGKLLFAGCNTGYKGKVVIGSSAIVTPRPPLTHLAVLHRLRIHLEDFGAANGIF
jgi:hypothetical protein